MTEKFDAQEIYDAITWRTKKRLLANVKSLIDDTGDDGPEIWTEHTKAIIEVALYEAEIKMVGVCCDTCNLDFIVFGKPQDCPLAEKCGEDFNCYKPKYTKEYFK